MALRTSSIIGSNLLDNAFKYTRTDDNVQVTVEQEDNEAVLTVKDDRIGIPADLLLRIFDVFVQGTSSITRRAGGLGIGLQLARPLVELHGGTIAVSSDGEACGGTFTVRLPSIQSLVTADRGVARHVLAEQAHCD